MRFAGYKTCMYSFHPGYTVMISGYKVSCLAGGLGDVEVSG